MTECCGIKATGLLFLLILFSTGVNAQYHAQRKAALKANSNWFFGTHGLNFNQQPPQLVATPGFFTVYTSFYGTEVFKNTTVFVRSSNLIPASDPVTGSLRFIATFSRVLDKNFAVMPNGDFSDLEIPKENYEKVILAAPVIRDPVRYYHFSLAASGDSIQLLQSIINMNLNGGLGDVEPATKNTMICRWKNENVITELIEVLPGNNCDYWLLAVANHVNTKNLVELFAFHITEAGVDPVPTVTTFEKDNPNTVLWDFQMSPDRRLLSIMSYFTKNALDFLVFNAETGSLSGGELPTITFPGIKGGPDVHGTFTPDNRYYMVYTGLLRDSQAVFYKYDLSASRLNYRLDSFSYPMRSYRQQDPKWDIQYLPPTLYFKAYDNKLYTNIPESIRAKIPRPGGFWTDEYGNPYYSVKGYSAVKLLPFGPAGSTDPWSQFSFEPEIPLSQQCRLFTNNSINYPYLAEDTIPTVYDSILCLNPDESFPVTTLSAPPGFTNYVWNDGATGPSKVINQPGKYWVFYKGSCNNRVDTFFYRLWIPTNVLPPDTMICEQRLPIIVSPLREGQYYWVDIGSANPDRRIDGPGTYKIEFNDLGCTQFDSIVVQTKNCPCGIGLPNAFSPNDDGVNDYFKPVIALGCVPKQYSLRVFNRWGQLVYQSFNEFDKGWNGTYNGNRADGGVYFYELRFKSDFLEQPYMGRGELILVR